MTRPAWILVPSFAVALIACSSTSGDEPANAEHVDAQGIPTSFCVGVKGEAYGAGLTELDVVFLSEILADPRTYDGKTVRVEGIVTDVCPRRGCWFEIAGENPGEKLRFKVDDGEMVFPMSAKGQYATGQGTLVVEELSLEQTRAREEHFAQETGSEFDPATITEGSTVLRIQGTGAIIGTKI